jgi:hypothetical protein
MRKQTRRRRSRLSRRARGGTRAFVGQPYSSTNLRGNYYKYNDTPKLGYPAYNTHTQRGGGWQDMFDPRARPIQPLWSVKDSIGHAFQSGINTFMGKYPAVDTNPVKGHFQK